MLHDAIVVSVGVLVAFVALRASKLVRKAVGVSGPQPIGLGGAPNPLTATNAEWAAYEAKYQQSESALWAEDAKAEQRREASMQAGEAHWLRDRADMDRQSLEWRERVNSAK